MNNETNMGHALIKLMFNREHYYHYVNFIKKEMLTEHIVLVLEDLDHYYTDQDEVQQVNLSDFMMWFSNIAHRSFSPDLMEMYKQLLLKVGESKSETAEGLIEYFNLEALKRDIEKTFTDSSSIPEIVEICKKYMQTSKLSHKLDSNFCDMEHDESATAKYYENQLNWRLGCLNTSIGTIGAGDFGIVFAGTDAGKTSFLCSEVSFMLKQLKENDNILWFFNEGSIVKLKMRFWSACLGKTNTEMYENLPQYKELYREYCEGNINKVRFYKATDLSISDVGHLVKTYKPRLVIIDQLDNLAGFEKAARDDIRALKLFQRARSIAIDNECCMMVTDQATETQGIIYNKETGKKEMWYKRWLTKEQLQGSRLAKQSTAEFMIGIGYDPETPDLRYITTPKVKSMGGTNDNELQAKTYFRKATAVYED